MEERVYVEQKPIDAEEFERIRARLKDGPRVRFGGVDLGTLDSETRCIIIGPDGIEQFTAEQYERWQAQSADANARGLGGLASSLAYTHPQPARIQEHFAREFKRIDAAPNHREALTGNRAARRAEIAKARSPKKRKKV